MSSFRASSGETQMTRVKLLSAAALLSALAVAPSLAAELRVPHIRAHHVRYHHGLPYEISYLHNYGPGVLPGSFAYYDGPSTVHCEQSAAAYLGQDRRRYPCN
jgi:hypothetical protein